MNRKALRVFVLADTHNHLPENLEALADDVDEIWHLGDVCAPDLIVRLESIGPPLTFVRGNCDTNFEWPLTVDLERNGVRCRLVHIPPAKPPEGIDVLLHGHTHVPRHEQQGRVLFLNPGCVTRPDKGAPPSIATLEITAQGRILWRLTRLR